MSTRSSRLSRLRPPPGRPRRADSATERVHRRLLQAVLARQLPPGTQLVEHRLAEIFGVSRTIVRQAILRLAQDGIVESLPHRGAFIRRLSVVQAREVFDARRIIEPELIRRLCRRPDVDRLARLRAHVAREEAARAARDQAAVVRLTGEFHQLLAEMAGNTLLADTLADLEVLTTLAILTYEAGGASACPTGEHRALLAAVEAGDGDGAARRMLDHLMRVEAALDLCEQPRTPVDLDTLLDNPSADAGDAFL